MTKIKWNESLWQPCIPNIQEKKDNFYPETREHNSWEYEEEGYELPGVSSSKQCPYGFRPCPNHEICKGKCNVRTRKKEQN